MGSETLESIKVKKLYEVENLSMDRISVQFFAQPVPLRPQRSRENVPSLSKRMTFSPCELEHNMDNGTLMLILNKYFTSKNFSLDNHR